MTLTSVDVMMKQYEELRKEVLAAIANRLTIVQFGFAIMGAGLAAGVGFLKDAPQLSSFIFFAFIPFSNWSTTLIWLEEYIRINRAGKFMFHIEDYVKSSLRLSDVRNGFKMWEHYLEEEKLHRHIANMMTIIHFLLTGFFSMVIGAHVAARVESVKEFVNKHLQWFTTDLSIEWKLIVIGITAHLPFYAITFAFYYKGVFRR